MTETFIHIGLFMMMAGVILLQLLTLFRFRGVYRKLNWWRNKAVKTNNELKNLGDKMNDVVRAKGGSSNELSNSNNPPANAQ